MKKKTPYTEIAKRFNRDASPKEMEKVRVWVDDSMENRRKYKMLLKIWKLNKAFSFDVDNEKAWKRLSKQISQQHKKGGRIQQKALRVFLRCAAALLLLFAIGYIYKQNNDSVEKLVTIESGEQQCDVLLADGTKVHLNTHSTFSYPKVFSGNKRKVKLCGEAFFKVARNEQKPFIITTSQTQTRVLGTSFNLRAYQEETEETLVVATGKVSFSSLKNKEKVILLANQKGVYSLKKGSVHKRRLEDPNYKAWYNKVFTFDDQTLASIVTCLNQVYGVHLEIKDGQLAQERLSVSFEKRSLNEIMEILSATLDFNYVSVSGKIIIQK